jgi:type VI secretion system protein ImpC
MSKNETRFQQSATADAVVMDAPGKSVYEALCEKINLTPVKETRPFDSFQNADSLSESSLDERVAQAMNVFLKMIKDSSQQVDRLDKSLLDFHIAHLDQQISRQLDAIMHNETFQQIESAWRGLKFLVDRTDFRKNVRIEVLDVSKDALRQDFEDTPEIIQSGLYQHTYIQEYDTPGGEPIGSIISNYEFDRGPQDIALLRNISKVSAAAHMPFIGSARTRWKKSQASATLATISIALNTSSGKASANQTTPATLGSRCPASSLACRMVRIRRRCVHSTTRKRSRVLTTRAICGRTPPSPSPPTW